LRNYKVIKAQSYKDFEADENKKAPQIARLGIV
jgi:hypothetical protein